MYRLGSSLILLACYAAARAPDYFPLQVGNQWQYQCSKDCGGPDSITMEVTGIAPVKAADGSPYFVLRGFLNESWVRMVDSVRLVARDPQGSGEEKLWYDFGAPENQEYATSVHPCNVSAKITSRDVVYSGPLGSYVGLEIDYPATTCNLQGLVEETFVTGIGLAKRVDLVPGSRTYELVFAHVRGRDISMQKAVTFALSLDRTVYRIGLPGVTPAITAQLTLSNTTADPLHLSFAANLYDLEIKNDKGETVYLWSAGRLLPQVITDMDLSPGKRSWAITVPLEADFSRAWAPGTYTAEARLNTLKPAQYSARVSFQIEWVR